MGPHIIGSKVSVRRDACVHEVGQETLKGAVSPHRFVLIGIRQLLVSRTAKGPSLFILKMGK